MDLKVHLNFYFPFFDFFGFMFCFLSCLHLVCFICFLKNLLHFCWFIFLIGSSLLHPTVVEITLFFFLMTILGSFKGIFKQCLKLVNIYPLLEIYWTLRCFNSNYNSSNKLKSIFGYCFYLLYVLMPYIRQYHYYYFKNNVL